MYAGRPANLTRVRGSATRGQTGSIRSLHQGGVLGGKLRRLGGPGALYLDRSGDLRATLYLSGTRRSGATGFGRVLGSTPDTRLMIETGASRSRRERLDYPLGCYLTPGTPDERLEQLFDRLLSGQARARDLDRFNIARRPARRVVVDEVTANLLPWLTARYPAMPVVYVLHHPFAVAWSCTEFGMESDRLARALLLRTLGPADPEFRPILERTLFLYYVREWCVENVLALRKLPIGAVHPVFAEHLVADPAGEVAALQSYLAGKGGPWSAWRANDDAARELPRAVLERPDGEPDRTAGGVNAWRSRVDSRTVGHAIEVLGEYGLERVYGAEPTPLVGRHDLLRGPEA
jgi:hypothetical protein